MILFSRVRRIAAVTVLLIAGLISVGQTAYADRLSELLISLLSAVEPHAGDTPERVEARVSPIMHELNDERKFQYFSHEQQLQIMDNLGGLISSGKIVGDENYVLANHFMTRAAPHRLFADREALLTSLRRTFFSTDESVRAASVDITMDYFRREILPDVTGRASREWGEINAISREFAHPEATGHGRGLDAASGARKFILRAVMGFADLSAKPELLHEISKILNQPSDSRNYHELNRRHDLVEALVEPVRPKSQAELDALVAFAYSFNNYHSQDAAMKAVYKALHAEPPVGRLTPVTQQMIREISAHGSQEAQKLLEAVDGPEHLPRDTHSLLTLLREVHPGDSAESVRQRNQRILIALSQRMPHIYNSDEKRYVGETIEAMLKQRQIYGDECTVLAESILGRITGRTVVDQDALLSSVRRTLLSENSDVRRASLKLATTVFDHELQLPSTVPNEGYLAEAAAELANYRSTGTGSGIRHYGLDYIIYQAPTLGHALLQAADFGNHPGLLEEIGKVVNGLSHEQDRERAARALVEPLHARSLAELSQVTTLYAQLPAAQQEGLKKTMSEGILRFARLERDSLEACALRGLETAEGLHPTQKSGHGDR